MRTRRWPLPVPRIPITHRPRGAFCPIRGVLLDPQSMLDPGSTMRVSGALIQGQDIGLELVIAQPASGWLAPFQA